MAQVNPMKDKFLLDVANGLVDLSLSKAKLAKLYNTSDRSIGRWLAVSGPVVVQEPVQVDVEDWTPESEQDEDVQDEVEYRVIASKKSISVTKLVNEDVVGSVVVDKTNMLFQQIFDDISSNALSQESLERAYNLAQPAKALEYVTDGKLEVDVKNNKIYFNHDESLRVEVGGSIVDRITEGLKTKSLEAVQHLMKFQTKLMDNPSFRAVNELYKFIEATDIEIAEDGDFYAWKKVRSSYFDIHSNTMRNAPGDVLRVHRNMVDEDSSRTCSHGLHACSKSYLSYFGSYNGSTDRIVRVKINPADVCAVPADYQNAKLRCAGYTVIDDVTHQF